MGLGKTIEVLSLILGNPQGPDTPYTQTFFEGVPRIRTRATLVLCPSHLVKQWAVEACNKTKLRVETIWNKSMHTNMTYQHILDADIVVVSFNFLKSASYINSFNGGSHNTSFEGILGAAITASDIVDTNYGPTKAPILHLFDWHRIIYDGKFTFQK
jgi:SNF2 family DNA or RNA helicase